MSKDTAPDCISAMHQPIEDFGATDEDDEDFTVEILSIGELNDDITGDTEFAEGEPVGSNDDAKDGDSLPVLIEDVVEGDAGEALIAEEAEVEESVHASADDDVEMSSRGADDDEPVACEADLSDETIAEPAAELEADDAETEASCDEISESNEEPAKAEIDHDAAAAESENIGWQSDD